MEWVTIYEISRFAIPFELIIGVIFCVEGYLEASSGKDDANIEWHKGSFDLTVNDVKFLCDYPDSILRDHKAESSINENNTLRVYYYDDKMYDEYHKEYMAVRIDAWLPRED